MINLSVVEQPVPTMQWPENCQIGLRIWREIEADHAQPQRQRADELAQLRSGNALLEQRVASLERQLAKLGDAYNRTARHLGDAADGLNLMMFGEPESLPKSKAELEGFEPNIVRMIRGHACTKEIAARLADLERRPIYKFVGTFVEGSEYSPGNICVRSGGSWICTENTKDIPGKSPCWAQLCRAGRDGRDNVVREPVLK